MNSEFELNELIDNDDIIGIRNFDFSKLHLVRTHPLKKCAEINREDIFYYLIEKGISMNSYNYKYNSPLFFYACRNNNLGLAEYLRKNGDNVFFTNQFGDNCLSEVLRNKNVELETINYLIGLGFNVKKNNILAHCATHDTSSEIILELIKAGADVNETDSWGFTPLINAISAKNLRIIKLLIEQGANASGNTVIGMIIRVNNNEINEYFSDLLRSIQGFKFDNAQDLNYALDSDKIKKIIVDNPSFVPSEALFSIYNCNIELMTYRLEINYDTTINYGIDLIESAKNNAENIMLWHQETSFLDNIEKGIIWRLLIENESDYVFEFCLNNVGEINFSDKNFIEVFNQLVFSGNMKMIEKLIKIGLVIHEKDILSYAVLSGNIETVKLIYSLGFNEVNRFDHRGNTPIMYAVFYGYCDIFDFLIEHGADVKLSNGQGNTLLFISLFQRRENNLDMIKKLLEFVDVNEANKKYRDSVIGFLCYCSNKKKVAKFLIKSGANIEIKDKDGTTIFTDPYSLMYRKD